MAEIEEREVVYLNNRRGKVKRIIPADQENLYEVSWDDGKSEPNIIEESKLKREPLDRVFYKMCPLCFRRTGGKTVSLLKPADNLDNPNLYKCKEEHLFRKRGEKLIYVENGKETEEFDISELEPCPWDKLR